MNRCTYWERSFPSHFEISLNLEEAQFYGADELPYDTDSAVVEGRKAKGCFATITRVGTSRRSIQAKLKKFVRRDGESWNAMACDFVAYVWESSTKKGPLAGFASIGIDLTRNVRGRIASVTFDMDLMYIARAHRGRGLGQMLSAAICAWLTECRVYGVVAKRGISVLYYSDFYSEGGGKCGAIVRDHFEYINESRNEIPARLLGWHIREFDDESDF
jgi:GNAT superfamily N-acetyltransferase